MSKYFKYLHRNKQASMCRDGGKVVGMLTFHSDDLSSKPAEAFSFF